MHERLFYTQVQSYYSTFKYYQTTPKVVNVKVNMTARLYAYRVCLRILQVPKAIELVDLF